MLSCLGFGVYFVLANNLGNDFLKFREIVLLFDASYCLRNSYVPVFLRLVNLFNTGFLVVIIDVGLTIILRGITHEQTLG